METCDTCKKELKNKHALDLHKAWHRRVDAAKVEEMRPQATVGVTWEKPNPLEVKNKDPNKRYRFLSPELIKRRGMRGWEPCPAEDPAKVDCSMFVQPDSMKRANELILGYMPEEVAKAREKYHAEQNNPKSMEEEAEAHLASRLPKGTPALSIKKGEAEVRMRR